jgi:hypothetical protein
VFLFRKVADYSDGTTRVVRYNEINGQKILVDPETNEPKPWPLLGVTMEGDIRSRDKIGMHYVANAVNEGWAKLTNSRTVHRPGGTPENPWSTTHTFRQGDQVVFHLIFEEDGKWVERDVTYDIISQPDKVQDESEPSGWRVDWTYELELVTDNG